jgi:hypothetical protein
MLTRAFRNPIAPSTLLAAALAFSLPRTAVKAENSLEYKLENYREDDDRITVVTDGAAVNQDVGLYGHLQLTGTIDAVSGATPTGRPAPPGSDQVVLTEIHTRRKAWSGDYSEQIRNFNIDAGFAESRESDYVSYGWSLNTLTDFNEKNTTLRAGIAGTDDRVEVFYEPAYLPKHSNDAILGVTQLLSPTTFVTVNLTAGRSSGYLSEPHKFVEKAVEILPGLDLEEGFGENSPNTRDREALFASINHAFVGVHGAIEGSYRFYTDTFGIVAHTVALSWIQHVGGRVILEPFARFYTQTAASFYIYNLDDSPAVPVHIPMGTAPYYSSDFRLSADETTSLGLKVTLKVNDWMQVNGSFERYDMRGRDGVTPASAYPDASISTVGVKFLW